MTDDTSTLVAETIIALEKSLHAPEWRRSFTQLDAVLANDFVEYGRSGRAYTKSLIIARLTEETDAAGAVASWGYESIPLAPGLVQLRYCSARRAADGLLSDFARRSSIWRQSSSGAWQMSFHQGTATSGDVLECVAAG